MSAPLAPFARPVHGLERVWLAADRAAPPFVNQLVVEGEGVLDEAAWARACATAAAAHPFACARLRGAGRWSRWTTDGPQPRVRVVDGARWDGRSGAGADFLRDPLDPARGPVAEVLLVRGDTPRMVYRSHHAALDGRAARGLAEDVARAARGEACVGAASGPTDLEVAARALGRPALSSAPPREARVPWAFPPGPTMSWARVDWQGDTRALLPRFLCALHDVARAHAPDHDGPLRVSVPVDLLARADLPAADANLSGIARVSVAANTTPDDVRAALDGAIAGADGALVAAHALRDLPLWVLAAFGRLGARRLARLGRSDADVTVSNLGRAAPSALDGAGFRATRAFYVPPANPGNPLFITLAGTERGCVSCAAAIATDAEALASFLRTVFARM